VFKSKNGSTGISTSFDSLIGEKSIFDGNLTCEGAIRIDGIVKGDIKATEDVVIGEKAEIYGNVTANNVQVSGTVQGNIYAKYTVRLCSSSRLNGDIEAASLISEEGAFFTGKCNMIEPSDT